MKVPKSGLHVWLSLALLLLCLPIRTVAVQITTTNLPSGAVGEGYRLNLTAGDGQPPYSWQIISNSLPSGFDFSYDEAFAYISGIPAHGGAYYFTVQVTDADSQSATRSFNLLISEPLNSGVDWRAAATADFNADGKPDVVWQRNDSLLLWFLNGTNLISSAAITNNANGARAVLARDFDGDNKTDLLLQDSDGSLVVWLMNSNQVLNAVFLRNGEPVVNGGHVVGIANLTGNGTRDLVIADENGNLSTWLMNGTNFLAEMTVPNNIPPQSTAIGNFNTNAPNDILVRQVSNFYYLSLSTNNVSNPMSFGNTTDSGPALPVIPPDWRIAGVADFNGDGQEDIAWQSVESGSLFFWHLNQTNLIGFSSPVNGPVSAPQIAVQPASQTVLDRDTVKLSVVVSGDTPLVYPLAYQWLKNGANILLATNATLLFSPIQMNDAGDYLVIVSDSSGSVTSQVATITVNGLAPTFLSSGQNITARVGTPADLSFAYDGTLPISLQWRHDGVDISGATNSTLHFASAQLKDTGGYTLVLSNLAGVAESDTSYLTVVQSGADVVFYSLAKEAAYTQESSATPVVAGDPVFPYRFLARVKESAPGFVSGASVVKPSSAIVNLSASPLGYSSYDEYGALTSLNNDFPSGTYHFNIQTFNDGNRNIALNLPATAFPATPHISNYDAAQNINPAIDFTITWDALSGGTTNDFVQVEIFVDDHIVGSPGQFEPGALNGLSKSFTIPAGSLTENLQYVAHIVFFKVSSRNTSGYPGAIGLVGFRKDVSFSIQTGTALPLPSILEQPQNQTVIVSNDVTFSVTAEGSDLSYQWRFNDVAINGATDDSLTLTNIQSTDTGDYNVLVSNSAGSVISSNATLAVLVPPAIIKQPQSQSSLANKNVSLSVTATGTAPLSYFWFLAPTTTLPSATNAVLTLTNAQPENSGDYFVVVSNAAGVVISTQASVSIKLPVSITTQPQGQTAMVDSQVFLDVEATGTGPLFYQWRLNNVNISGATNSFLSLDNVQTNQSGTYRVVVSNAVSSALSSNAVVKVLAPPVITTQPQSKNAAVGTSTSLKVVATGTAPLRYQWQFNGTNLRGATGATLSLPTIPLTKSGTYAVTVSNAVGVVTSDSAVVNVVPPAPVITSPANNFQTTNTALSVSGTAAKNAGITKVQFQLNDGAFIDATGTTAWRANFNLIAGTNVFRVRAVNDNGESAGTTRSFFLIRTNRLIVLVNGNGTISPNWTNQLLITRRGYTITAIPGPNQLFAGWSGGIVSSEAKLSFLMEPNLVLQANFASNIFIPVAGTYTGLFHDTNYIAHESCGFFTLLLSSNQTFSGKVLIGGATNAFSGKFNLSGHAVLSIPVRNQSPLEMQLQVDLESGSDQITGTLANDTITAELVANRSTFSTTHPATNFNGVYTILFPASEDPATAPGGVGYGLVTVSAAGNVTANGMLGDGTVFNNVVPIGKDGQWPLYLPLYSGKGSMFGWLQFSANTPHEVSGNVLWFKKPVITGALYRNGFTSQLSITGSAFASPPRGTRALDFTNGIAVLTDGNLATPLTNGLVLKTNNTFTVSGTNKLAITLNTTSGLLTGSFFHPKTRRTTTFKGAISQENNFGAGPFLGTNQSGTILIQGIIP